MTADEVNMNRKPVRLILNEELWMKNICTKMVLRNLTEKKRDAWLSAVFDIQMHYSDVAASSPDVSSREFFLFLKVKTALKGCHFESTEDDQKPVTQILNDISQNTFQEYNGSTAAKGVCRHKGCTFKVTTL
jgi:hypothetical protein